jgi:O-antigen ligase
LLGETNLLTIGSVKVPALFSFLFFGTAFVLSRRKDFSFLFRNRIFNLGLLYFIVIFLNYAFVNKDLFFKVYDELTPLWISLFRRIVTALFIFFTFRDERQAIRIFHFYIGGLVLSSLAAYPEMLILKHHLFDPGVSEGNEGYQRAIGFFSNPNDFALTTVISIIYIYHRYLRTGNKAMLLLCLLLVPPIFWSYSRNALACLVLAMALNFYLGRGLSWKLILYLGLSFVGLCVVVLSVPSIRERLFLLFSGEDTSAVGRVLVMIAAYQKWLTMPVWGIGILSAPLLLEDAGNEGLLITIHNFYAHALFESGIVGFVVVILFLRAIFLGNRRIYRLPDVDPQVRLFTRATLIALIVTFFYIFSGNHIIFEFFWYLIGVQLVLARALAKKTAEQKNLAYG